MERLTGVKSTLGCSGSSFAVVEQNLTFRGL